MNYTENYQLPQWEKTDRIMMEDFNEAMQKLDGAVRITCGTYTGNGAATRDIELGFRPRAVYVCTRGGLTGSVETYEFCYGGLALDGSPAMRSGQSVITVTDNGFRLSTPNSTYVLVNHSSYQYCYIAFQ